MKECDHLPFCPLALQSAHLDEKLPCYTLAIGVRTRLVCTLVLRGLKKKARAAFGTVIRRSRLRSACLGGCLWSTVRDAGLVRIAAAARACDRRRPHRPARTRRIRHAGDHTARAHRQTNATRRRAAPSERAWWRCPECPLGARAASTRQDARKGESAAGPDSPCALGALSGECSRVLGTTGFPCRRSR